MKDIDFSLLPNQFVIKTNHGSGNVVIVKDKEEFLHSSRYRIVKNYLEKWMQMDYGYDDGFELHYSKIEPYIFVEEYVPALSDVIKEYRFMCFEGTPRYITVKISDVDGKKYRNVYDTDWNFLTNIQWGPTHTIEDPYPEALPEMLDIARKLASGFHFVRVDLNYVPGVGIFFGEMTFTSGSGFTKIEPYSFCAKLGDFISVP